MTQTVSSSSAQVHDRLDHPVIDGDGHWLEPMPIFLEYLDEVGGSASVDAFREFKSHRADWYRTTPEQRRARRMRRQTWWGEPSGHLDRATASLPALYYERLADFGIDYSLLYPTIGLNLYVLADDDLRRHTCRALNRMGSEMFAPYADRITPVATIPTATPEEAIEELEYCVHELGTKVAVIAGTRFRMSAEPDPHQYVDAMGLESHFDYDPLWAKFVELNVGVTDHAGTNMWPDRNSVDNYTFNHVGHIANGQHCGCRAVFLGGVVNRFPTLKFAFLEGGIGWACNLLLDLVGHYEKRNRDAMMTNVRPANMDRAKFLELYDKYASGRMVGRGEELLGTLSPLVPFQDLDELTAQEGEVIFDDFEAAGVKSADDLRQKFRRNFYFGCEADDPMTAVAFNAQLGTLLKPIFSSDVSHFDVIDMSEVLEEAWELVEHGLINEEQFKQFTFTNAAEMHLGMNPDFFKGTAIEAATSGLSRVQRDV